MSFHTRYFDKGTILTALQEGGVDRLESLINKSDAQVFDAWAEYFIKRLDKDLKSFNKAYNQINDDTLWSSNLSDILKHSEVNKLNNEACLLAYMLDPAIKSWIPTVAAIEFFNMKSPKKLIGENSGNKTIVDKSAKDLLIYVIDSEVRNKNLNKLL